MYFDVGTIPLIYIAGFGFGYLLGLGLLYYAEISHWVRSRLWSPD